MEIDEQPSQISKGNSGLTTGFCCYASFFTAEGSRNEYATDKSGLADWFWWRGMGLIALTMAPSFVELVDQELSLFSEHIR